MIPLIQVSKVVKLTEAESRMVVAKDWMRRKREAAVPQIESCSYQVNTF